MDTKEKAIVVEYHWCFQVSVWAEPTVEINVLMVTLKRNEIGHAYAGIFHQMRVVEVATRAALRSYASSRLHDEKFCRRAKFVEARRTWKGNRVTHKQESMDRKE